MTAQERIDAVARLGFTERQARFLVTVMSHSGVCLPRQYATLAGVAYGHGVSRFFERIVSRGFASAAPCLHNRALSTTFIIGRCTPPSDNLRAAFVGPCRRPPSCLG